jgi:long-chain acyl-CoA synthetase
MSAEELLAQDFGAFPDLVRAHARERPDHPALIEGDAALTYSELAALMDRVAFALQRDGVGAGEAVAICARTSISYAAAFSGILAAGAAVAPLAPSSTAASLAMMIKDCDAKVLFLDRETGETLAGVGGAGRSKPVALDGSAAGELFSSWLGPEGAKSATVEFRPDWPFNIIYSSGTTGAPKGIVQPHEMRWRQFTRASYRGAVTLVSTPLYSNTTLVVFIPTLAHGGTAVLLPKFDAGEFLRLSERRRVTHAMLVPVQYRRIMDRPDFGDYDLSSYIMKASTSAPFSAALKADVLSRWPGGLTEYYGMTEGGGSTMLAAHEFPHKLHTVGQPMPGHDIRLIDEEGREVAQGEIGEVVGSSGAIMTGYHNQPEKTREAEWRDAEGRRFIRTGDIGRIDEDGFLILLDRSKDIIISGGFNIYPSDIEAELMRHEDVVEAAVVGAPSERWGETPVGFVTLRTRASVDGPALLRWVNARLGKTQRLSELTIVESLPRSAIGKILKRELRNLHSAGSVATGAATSRG